MPEIIPGFTTEQKVIAVADDAATINAEITTQAADGWIVNLMIVSGLDIIILFSRNVAISEE